MLTKHEQIAFERWALLAGLSVKRAFFNPSAYRSGATNAAWLAWLARADFAVPYQ